MTPITPKSWADMQSRCALAGMQLMKSEGAATVVVLIDRKGKPHRLHDIQSLEDVLLSTEYFGVAS